MAWWAWTIVNTGLSNGLLPDSTNPLCYLYYAIHLNLRHCWNNHESNYYNTIANYIFLKSMPHPPGNNELMSTHASSLHFLTTDHLVICNDHLHKIKWLGTNTVIPVSNTRVTCHSAQVFHCLCLNLTLGWILQPWITYLQEDLPSKMTRSWTDASVQPTTQVVPALQKYVHAGMNR